MKINIKLKKKYKKALKIKAEKYGVSVDELLKNVLKDIVLNEYFHSKLGKWKYKS